MARPFDLVVFDVGGVLVRADREWFEAVERAGFSMEPRWREQFEARLRTLPHRGVGAVDSERYFKIFAEASQGVFTAEDARRITEASLLEEYPGVGQIFDALDPTGIATAALSNTHDAEWARMFPSMPESSAFPTLLRLQYRFASHLMRVQKPAAQAFQLVEAETGCSGERILFFDDRTENIESARSCGWTAELIDHTGDPTEQVMALLATHRVLD